MRGISLKQSFRCCELMNEREESWVDVSLSEEKV